MYVYTLMEDNQSLMFTKHNLFGDIWCQCMRIYYTHTHTHTQDHDVQEENILFVSILAAKLGLHSVAYAYPRVRIVTSAVDNEVNDNFHIIPGVGNYGDRYFGTEPDLGETFTHNTSSDR